MSYYTKNIIGCTVCHISIHLIQGISCVKQRTSYKGSLFHDKMGIQTESELQKNPHDKKKKSKHKTTH